VTKRIWKQCEKSLFGLFWRIMDFDNFVEDQKRIFILKEVQYEG